MKKRIVFLISLIIFIFNLFGLAGDQVEENGIIRRFALVVGSNYGGSDRAKLLYAVSDAKAIIKILEDMGGVSPDDSRLLVEPTRETFFWEMGRLKKRIGRAGKKHGKVEVILYYSGHSNEHSILLGKEKVSYKEFRDEITSMTADVRIAILDSCASGAFTRLKGGKKKVPFLMDTAYDMKGYAFMTSSSSNEASQESDRLKGSFFTHHLISGLRGAADMSQDGRITLSEAYQFAFNETLVGTTETISGPQHPNYNIRMSGTGDVVMTDIRKSSSHLKISKDISGRIFIHNLKNVLVVELNKTLGRPIELGMDAGKYRVINIVEGNIFEVKINLLKGKCVELNKEQLIKIDKIDAIARGDLKAQSKRNVVLKIGKMRLFAEILTKSTKISGDWVVLMGGNFGLTFGRTFSVGVAGYGKINFPTPGSPGYGGITLEYSFIPGRKIHFKIGALLGSGVGFREGIFYIFEPELKLILNLSHIVRIGGGISIPFTDKKSAGFKNPSIVLSFQFGK